MYLPDATYQSKVDKFTDVSTYMPIYFLLNKRVNARNHNNTPWVSDCNARSYDLRDDLVVFVQMKTIAAAKS